MFYPFSAVRTKPERCPDQTPSSTEGWETVEGRGGTNVKILLGVVLFVFTALLALVELDRRDRSAVGGCCVDTHVHLAHSARFTVCAVDMAT